MIPVADASVKIVSHQFCVMYDPDTGRIISVFESITLDGARVPDREKVETRARELSAQLIQAATEGSLDDTHVETTFVGPEAFATAGPKRVDLGSLTVVAAEE